MANKIQKVIFNISSVAPLSFIFAFLWYVQMKTWYIPLAFVCVGVVLIALFGASFSYAKRHISAITIHATGISPKDHWVITYFLTYLLPFASLVIAEWNLCVCVAIGFCIIVFLPQINSGLPNFLLFICGYHFYSISAENGVSDYLLITQRRALRNTKSLKSAKRIFEYVLLEEERR